MNIPTIASIKKAASKQEGQTVGDINVGIRDNANGEETEDSNLWPGWNEGDPDGDLVDGPLPLKDTLKKWRKSPPPTTVVLDMYCYKPRTQDFDSGGLICNLDLWYDQETDAWYVRDQYTQSWSASPGTKVLLPESEPKPKGDPLPARMMKHLQF